MSQTEIHNAAELEALVQERGFLPFFACSIPNFSIEDFTPSRYWFVSGVEGPWDWRMDAARRGVVAYGKLFSRKAGLVSREWYPDLANYRRDGYDFDARYEEGLASYREKRVMDVLLREGPTLSKDLKRLAGSLAQGGWIFQPPRAAVGDHLEGRGAASPGVGVEGGNQRQGLPVPVLVLQIPAFKIGGRRRGATERTHNLHHLGFSFAGIGGFYNLRRETWHGPLPIFLIQK